MSGDPDLKFFGAFFGAAIAIWVVWAAVVLGVIGFCIWVVVQILQHFMII